MSLPVLLGSRRLRRGFAVASVVLATGGLVLYKASPSAARPGPVPHESVLAAGKNSALFHGPGGHGVVSLSHTSVVAGSPTSVFAEVRLAADPAEQATERAPISMAVVLDTSGSMSGDKIEEAKRAVLSLIDQMRDEDEIALVRYDSAAEVVQPLARVGDVRGALTAKVRALRAGGGTNIALGLTRGRRALTEAGRGRVERIVLVSDGHDNGRARAETVARESFASGVTVSSLGIGLGFDEAYMGAVAETGHGNFAFVKDGAALAGFLERELRETSTTTIQAARVRLHLPAGVRFVSATGADARVEGRDVELAMGSLFAGDERRAIVELSAAIPASTSAELAASAAWSRVGGDDVEVGASPLALVATTDADAVARGKDPAVLASAASALASRRQVEAAAAYARGDVRGALRISAQNERSLANVAAVAAPEQAAGLKKQLQAYREMKSDFASILPGSAEGKAAAKSATAKEHANLARKAYR